MPGEETCVESNGMKLLVIIVRGLQAGAAGPYGNRWIETDSLDALAAQGVVFDQHFAVHPDPPSARRVWRTGRHDFPLAPGVGPWPDLLEALRGAGVATHLLLDDSRPTPEEWTSGWGSVRREANSARAAVAAWATLDAMTAPSWLVWLELGALLPPWRPAEEIVEAYFTPAPLVEEEDEEDELVPEEAPLEPLLAPPSGQIDPDDDDLFLRVQTSYAAAVSHVDGLLGNLLNGLADDVHVLLTADYGQALGEHGWIGPDRASLHEEVVHVPLVAAGPGCRPGRRVEALTASTDLAATIADLAGVKLEGAQGVSLVPLLGGGAGPERGFVALGVRSGEAVEWGLRSPEWALLLPMGGGPARLYVKPDDRCEVYDVGQQHEDRLAEMERVLRAFVESSRRPGPVAAPSLEA